MATLYILHPFFERGRKVNISSSANFNKPVKEATKRLTYAILSKNLDVRAIAGSRVCRKATY